VSDERIDLEELADDPEGRIQMYNLGGEYPGLPTRLVAWPDYCVQVERAEKAERARAAREDTEQREEKLREAAQAFVDAALNPFDPGEYEFRRLRAALAENGDTDD
jgi:hypothetical protein